MPLGVDRLRSRNGSNAGTLHLGTESLYLFFCFCLSSTRPRPPLVPYFMRAPPFQVGLVLACLGRLLSRWGRLVQARPSSPPSSGLGLFPLASAFSFPLPFQGSPAPGQVCWCWCFLLVPPLFFCVPRPASRLSNYHLIFMLISPSFLFILIFISWDFHTLPSRVCVCVRNV